MNLEYGKTYRLRNGDLMRCTGASDQKAHPVAGDLWFDNEWVPMSWTEDGRYNINKPSGFDVVEEAPAQKVSPEKSGEELLTAIKMARNDAYEQAAILCEVAASAQNTAVNGQSRVHAAFAHTVVKAIRALKVTI